MISNLSDQAAEILAEAEKRPLAPLTLFDCPAVMDREDIEAVLPHRDPFLFMEEVAVLDMEQDLVVARYPLEHAHKVLAGHFPGQPVLPGVLQVEAIGQAGILLWLKKGGESAASVSLTHIQGARFIRPVQPGGDLVIVARVIEEGLFITVIGQCLQRGQICSAAVLTALL